MVSFGVWRMWSTSSLPLLSGPFWVRVKVHVRVLSMGHIIYQMKSDEKILKTFIYRNILLTDPNKKIKLIYYYKLKTSNLVIKNNSSPSIGVLQKTNIIYHRSDEKILKTFIYRNILPTDPNKKKIKLIYYNKFKTSNLVIKNNSAPSIGVLRKTNVLYIYIYIYIYMRI